MLYLIEIHTLSMVLNSVPTIKRKCIFFYDLSSLKHLAFDVIDYARFTYTIKSM